MTLLNTSKKIEQIRYMYSHEAKICVIGGGAFGFALAYTSILGGCDVTHILKNEKDFNNINHDVILQKAKYELQDITTIDLTEFDLIIVAVPSQVLREVSIWMRKQIQKYAKNNVPVYIICASKGIEINTLQLPYEIMNNELEHLAIIGALSGPTFAKELRNNLPAALVMATTNNELKCRAKTLLHRDAFRIYDSNDIIGVEIAGALKNVIAIVAGACDGLGLGNNARSAVVTRGFGEIIQIGMKLGAEAITFLGLSGLGDLFLTTTGDLSRNRQFGLRLAAGESKEEIIKNLGEVVEGLTTSQSAYFLSQKYKLDTPIINVAYGVLYGNLSVQDALFTLVTRQHKGEFEWMTNVYSDTKNIS